MSILEAHAPPKVDCPRCGLAGSPSDAECARCGVVYSKLAQAGPEPAPAGPPGSPSESKLGAVDCRDEYAVSSLEPEGQRALLVGSALAAAVLAFPFTRFVLSYLIILVHELGHAAFGWMFGYPSIPAFDFYYGGGVTTHEGRQLGLLVVIYLGWAVLLYAARRSRRGLIALSVLLAGYTVCLLTPLHEQLIVFMGHGTELVFAGIFLYRALSGYAVKVAAERPLYAMLALFILAHDLHFAVGLAGSEARRQTYGEAKGGGHWMDFSVLAHDLGLDLSHIGALFALACLIVTPVTWLLFRFRHGLGAGLYRLFRTSG